jgi:hypothetical protein
MFIKKQALSRRTLLRGIGTAVALPFLDSMVPAQTPLAKTVANPQQRFGAVFVPLGTVKDSWVPKTAGANFDFSPTLKPLEPMRKWITVVTDVCDPEPGHATTVSGWLSGSLVKPTMAEDVRAGITIDQLLAKQMGQETPYPSLELATEDFTAVVGGCTPGYACAYSNTISWKTSTQPLPMEINPRVVFERMYGRPGTREQRLARMQADRSILDSLRDDVAEIEGRLGASDRTRLSDYLENIREIEQRIQRTEKQASTKETSIEAPIGVPDSFEEHVKLQFELLALGYRGDITRVFTFMVSRDASQRVYSNLGLSEPHHSISHHGGNPDKLSNLVKIQTYHVQLFADFLAKLRDTPDGDGSLLDHAAIIYGSGMGDSNVHSRFDIPTVIAGGLCGSIKGNRTIQPGKETPFSNVLLGLVNKFGVQLDNFGVSTGHVDV